MKQLNTIPIENFLEKARVAIKTNQKNLTLSINEVQELQNSLSAVMVRLLNKTDQMLENSKPEKIQIKMDGGKF